MRPGVRKSFLHPNATDGKLLRLFLASIASTMDSSDSWLLCLFGGSCFIFARVLQEMNSNDSNLDSSMDNLHLHAFFTP